jgi:hypothetical protein
MDKKIYQFIKIAYLLKTSKLKTIKFNYERRLIFKQNSRRRNNRR